MCGSEATHSDGSVEGDRKLQHLTGPCRWRCSVSQVWDCPWVHCSRLYGEAVAGPGLLHDPPPGSLVIFCSLVVSSVIG